METVLLKYDGLFSVQLLHSGYNLFQQNLVGQDIKIRPDTATQKLFVNHAMNYSFSNGTLLCFMRSRPALPPAATPVKSFTEFDGNTRLRFMLFGSPAFLKKTQLAAAGSAQVYQFTNQANAGTNGFIAQHETGVNNDDLKAVSLVEPEESCLAVIDIHNNGAVNANYDLFGANSRMLNPAYKVRFVAVP